MSLTTALIAASPLALWALVEWVAYVRPDWPADCTPVEGGYQRWRKNRDEWQDEQAAMFNVRPEPKTVMLSPSELDAMTDSDFLDYISDEPQGIDAEPLPEAEQKYVFGQDGARQPKSAKEWKAHPNEVI